ncbi:MAG: efflux RND transporter periplasmic adaptor subunit [Sulfurovum sp.]|nr:efflux RND transporter periplasmic adaptor subunit [Sulfurovum sp.]
MIKIMILTLLLFTLEAQAEMKCEAGKCSTGDESSKKVTPAKPDETKNTGGLTAKEHAIMLEEEAKEKEKAKNDPAKIQERKNKRVIEQLFNVRTIKVIAQKAAKEQINYGYIVAQESRKIDVVSWYSGFVERLYANTLYKKVEEGEALVKIYSAEVFKAKQDYLSSLKFNAKRLSSGMLRGARAKLRLLNVCDKEIEAIKTTRTVDEYTTIYAPISGWVFMKSINEGSSIKKQQKLFEIVNLDTVWLEAKLFQKELSSLANLKNFSVKVESSTKTFKAKKLQLYPMMNPKEATATLRFLVDNAEGILLPGMYAKIHSSMPSTTKLLIPRTAAMRKDGQWYAFLATEFKGEYEPVKIEIEPLDNQYYIVKNGLSEGEDVVDNALFMMDSDAQINSIY